jgi:hypothetical protein
MPGEIRIYFEGDKSLKPGFDAFFREVREHADATRWKFRTVATGGTPQRDFEIGKGKHPAAWNILLRDSEGPLDPSRPPSGADSVFWMVEMMESWFHADKGALAQYYKKGFRKDALKPNPSVEEISKKDPIDGLNSATRETSKGKYHKTKHAPTLLELIEPGLVRKAAPNCERLFTAVLQKLA